MDVQAAAIFEDVKTEDVKTSVHGANNGHVPKVAKRTRKDRSMKQSLHYVSGAAGAAGMYYKLLTKKEWSTQDMKLMVNSIY